MTNSLASGGQAGSNALGSQPPKKRRGSKVTPDYGFRTVKYYPITEEELNSLFWLGLAITFCFSTGLSLCAFIIDVQRDFSFATEMEENVEQFWNYICVGAGVAASILLVAGIIFFCFGYTKINSIKNYTDFINKD